MNLLIFFAIPLATILLAIVLERILDRPILVAITFFAIYLIVAFALFALGTITDLGTALVAVIVYTLIAFITAYITKLARLVLKRLMDNNNDENHCNNNCNKCNNHDNDCNSDDDNLLTVSCRCNNGDSQDLLTINSSCGSSANNDDNDNGCGCGNNNRYCLNR